MRTFTVMLSALLLGSATMRAQLVAGFESQPLAHADTFYSNFTLPGTDQGFDEGNIHFPYYTSFGYFSSGFAFSNMTDSVHSGSGNEYSAKTAIGYGGSSKYAVAFVSDPVTYLPNVNINFRGTAVGSVVMGFYVTNNTYAYNSMKNGDAFARKFHNGDWFKLTVKGYHSGALTSDSVDFYLANFLFPDTTLNYILKDWQWVNLASLGSVDSLQFSLSSSDNGSFGMNTPAYFCMDNFTYYDRSLGAITPTVGKSIAYPNPVTDVLNIELPDNQLKQVYIEDITGSVITSYLNQSGKVIISTEGLSAGIYNVRILGDGIGEVIRFVKE